MTKKYKYCIPALRAGMQRKAAAVLLAAALCLWTALPAMAAGDGTRETFYISTAEDWLRFVDNCALDAWSRGRTVVLTGDVPLHNVDAAPVPAFSVVLAGGEVRDLNVVGLVRPSGQAANTGGIAGENYGSIENCTFSGSVAGTNRVGGIAGFNGPGGTLRGCVAGGAVTGKSMTGGIAGYSTGMILSSENHGAIGYPHVGYNTGGIVGRTSGYVDNCVNEGAVYGRRDVGGGIAGQAEPHIELQLDADRVATLRGEVNRLQQLVDNAAGDAADRLEPITDEVTGLSRELAGALRQASGSFGDAAAHLSETVGALDPAAGEIGSGMSALGETVNVTEPDAENAVAKISAGLDSLTAASDAASAVLDKAEAAFPKYDSDVVDENGNVLHKAGDMKAPSDLGAQDREQLLACAGALAGLFLRWARRGQVPRARRWKRWPGSLPASMS